MIATLPATQRLALCPERFLGPLYGHPTYEKGFGPVEGCSKPRASVTELVTVAFDFVNHDNNVEMVKNVGVLYPGMKINAAVKSKYVKKSSMTD